MMLRPAQSRPEVTAAGRTGWQAMLLAVPHHNASARAEAAVNGGVTVTVPLQRPRWLVPPLTWFIRLSAVHTVRLDRLGGEVWHGCDGHDTVEMLTDRFAAAHRLTFHEARVLVTEYLRSLVQRGVLAVEMPRPGAGPVPVATTGAP